MRANKLHGRGISVFRSLLHRGRSLLIVSFILLATHSPFLWAQTSVDQAAKPESSDEKIERLTSAVAQAQRQMDDYRDQLTKLREELNGLREELAAEKGPSRQEEKAPTMQAGDAANPAALQAAIDEIRERQAVAESQIATHDATKIETQSKYPLAVTGLLLFNGFVNTKQVDISASPAYALSGSGSTGLSLRQTVLGLDARGPHLWGATSRADLRVDFFANAAQSNYAASGVLRLRTAHAALNWANTEAFVELDRSILEPNEPTSLVSIAQPELAWAGNLWNWSPQAGVTHQFELSDTSRIKADAALIDTSDPQPPGIASNSPLTMSERSRWPGTETRIAFQNGVSGSGSEFGIGGYFSPHRDNNGDTFNAWATTIDLKLPLARRLELTANAYRGQALAGLGAGGYVNYVYQYVDSKELARALDDVGGWSQLKVRASQKVEMNAGVGTDNPFSREIHTAISSQNESPIAYSYTGLTRNRSFYSNVIYSPSAYLLFSLEYKRLWTNYATGPTDFSDSIGVGAGYKF